MTRSAAELGHGNTLYGQYMTEEKERLAKTINKLRAKAATGGPDDVLPRWKGEVRRQILMLPSVKVIERMSMFELRKTSAQVVVIEQMITKYSASRFTEIMGNGNYNRSRKRSRA